MPDRPTARRRRSYTVAVVGADGAGKTTVARRLIDEAVRPMVYVYLGPAIGSSNHALPTSRLVAWLKKRRLEPHMSTDDSVPPQSLLPEEARRRLPRGRIVKALGLVNRVAEEWYRQLIVAYHHLRGRVVICDRHYHYEYCPDRPPVKEEILSVRLHRWLLKHWYPRPDLTLFLDAPVETLYQRKPEWPIAFLERQRSRIEAQGKTMPEFTRIDGSAPLDTVIEEAQRRIAEFENGTRLGA